MALTVSFRQALSLFLQHLKAANVEQYWIARYTRALQGPLKRMIAGQLPPIVPAETVDFLPISEIPQKVIQDCMRLSRNLNDRIARRFFKFLIYADLLDRRLLPIRKTVLHRAIEQAPEHLMHADGASSSLLRFCPASVGEENAARRCRPNTISPSESVCCMEGYSYTHRCHHHRGYQRLSSVAEARAELLGRFPGKYSVWIEGLFLSFYRLRDPENQSNHGFAGEKAQKTTADGLK